MFDRRDKLWLIALFVQVFGILVFLASLAVANALSNVSSTQAFVCGINSSMISLAIENNHFFTRDVIVFVRTCSYYYFFSVIFLNIQIRLQLSEV